MKYSAWSLMVVSLLISPLWDGQSLAAPLTIPAYGAVLQEPDKQVYMKDQMQAIFENNVNAAKEKEATYLPPDGWTYTPYPVGQGRVDYMEADNKKSDRVLLQLHGGGYVLPLGDAHRNLALKMATLMDASQVYSVDYRIAPSHVYPAALEDAVNAYQDILHRGVNPNNIFLVGDSAGGNLAIELALYLKEHHLPQPAALALASPWTTFETIKKSSRVTNANKDMVLGTGTPLSGPVKEALYGGGLSFKDVRLSPNYADLSGLPPMLVQTGGNEVFLTENQKFVDKAIADGVDVTFSVYPGMPHDFALLFPYMQESVDSLNEIKDFANRTMKNQSLRQVQTAPIVGLYEFTVPDSLTNAFKEAGLRNFTQSMAQEPDTLSMHLAHDTSVANTDFVFEIYKDETALAAHRGSAHFKEYVDQVGSKLPDRKVYTLEPQALLEQAGPHLILDDKKALVNLVKVKVKAEENEAFKAIVLPEMQESIQEEPGIIAMYALTDTKEPNVWYFYEIYASPEVYAQHREKDYFKDYLAKTGPMLLDKEFHRLSLAIMANQGGLRYAK